MSGTQASNEDEGLGKPLTSLERQALKLEAIRPLAGGLSHEFNNILNVILAFGQGLTAELASEQRSSSALAEMLQAAQRGTELTHQLLAFSQQLFLQPRLVDLNEIVGRLEPLLHELAGGAIAVELVMASAPCRCKLDARQIERVLTALVAHACTGMHADGRITIRTDNVALSESHVALDGKRSPGPYVLLAIEDTGPDLEPAAVADLFEPFYSSKQLGRGAGLGLAAVWGCVQQCGGWIGVRSAPGQGTVFELYFPANAA